MGSLFKGRCYAANADAADAFFLDSGPFYTAGFTSYVGWFEKSGSTWQIKRQSIASNGTITNLTTSTATVPTFPNCDQSADFTDGITVGWGIAGVMVIAWAWRMYQRAAQ